MDGLPDDVVFNIVPRLPIKFLAQCKSVSKFWCNTIGHPSVADMHLSVAAAQEPSLLLLMRHGLSRHSIKVYPTKSDERKLKPNNTAVMELQISDKFFLENSCSGLLCISHKNEILICNPFNKETLTISPTITPGSTSIYGLGFSPETKEYKVVHVSVGSVECSIYTLGSNSWRVSLDKLPYPVYGRPVYAKGIMYWKIVPDFVYDEMKNHIISFDVGKEEFGIMNYPENTSHKDLMGLIELKGCLAAVDYSLTTSIEIWVLKDCVKKQWVKECSIGLEAPVGEPDNRHVTVIGLVEGGEIFFTRLDDEYYYYDPKTGKVRYVHRSGDPDTTVSDVISFRGSLVSLKAYDFQS